MQRRFPLIAVLALVAAAALGACGGDDGNGAVGNAQAQTGEGDATVALRDLKFQPEETTAQVGDTVVWVWEERVLHNVTGDDFESDNQSSGEFTHTFDEAGTYEYTCTLHPGMDGTVTVEE